MQNDGGSLLLRTAVLSLSDVFSLLTAYQFLTLLDLELRFHFLDQRFKLDLALFFTISIDVSCDAPDSLSDLPAA